jgi:hypothetical protein
MFKRTSVASSGSASLALPVPAALDLFCRWEAAKSSTADVADLALSSGSSFNSRGGSIMSQCLRHAVVLTAVFFLVSAAPSFGQRAEKQKARAAKRAAQNQVFQLPKDITLSEEQQTKLNALKEQYGPKLAAISAKQNEILTPEQRAARAEVAKANREAKKAGKEAQEAINAALKLTEEQKAKWTAAQKEMQDLRKEIDQKKRDLLTEEQKAKLPKRRAKS